MTHDPPWYWICEDKFLDLLVPKWTQKKKKKKKEDGPITLH
jgi:hypothetical protein